MSAPIARVFGAPGRTITTRPGHAVQLRGGMGHVYHGEDMPALLRHGELSIEVSPDQIDWLPGWAAKCGERTPAMAQVTVPGQEIGPAPSYVIPEPMDTTPSAVRRRRGKVGMPGDGNGPGGLTSLEPSPPDPTIEAALDDLLP